MRARRRADIESNCWHPRTHKKHIWHTTKHIHTLSARFDPCSLFVHFIHFCTFRWLFLFHSLTHVLLSSPISVHITHPSTHLTFHYTSHILLHIPHSNTHLTFPCTSHILLHITFSLFVDFFFFTFRSFFTFISDSSTHHTSQYTSHIPLHISHLVTHPTFQYTSHIPVHISHLTTHLAYYYTSHIPLHILHPTANLTSYYTSHIPLHISVPIHMFTYTANHKIKWLAHSHTYTNTIVTPQGTSTPHTFRTLLSLFTLHRYGW
jgi:hypothetical protein